MQQEIREGMLSAQGDAHRKPASRFAMKVRLVGEQNNYHLLLTLITEMFPLETVLCLPNRPKTARPRRKGFRSLCHGLWKFEQNSKRSFGIGVSRGREANEKYVCRTPTLSQPA